MAGIGTSIEIVDRISGSLNRITASLYSTTAAFQSVDTASETTFNASGVQMMAQEMYAYEQRIQQLETDLVDVNNQLEQMKEQNRKAAQSANILQNVYRGIAGIMGTIGLQRVLSASDGLTQTTSRIDMMNDGLQSTQELIQMVYGAAQDARGSFNGMADVVARFGNNAGSAFGSSAEIVDFANLIQKQMTIAGASTTEANAAMLQLSQGLGSGVLRGDELNSIYEQAPNLIQNIASYIQENEEIAIHMADVVGVSYEEMSTNAMGHIRDLASEGQLSADIVKNAIFASADEINEKFEEMPMTWAQIWQMMQNTALMKFQPVLQRLNDIANSSGFQRLVDGATTGMAVVANTAITIFDTVGAVGTFMADNWSVISPIIYGVVAALAVYGAYLAITNGIELVSKGIKIASCLASYAKAAATGAEVTATAEATAVQYGFNTALLACPITWIILAVIALIAIIIALCNWISKTTGITESGLGIVAGVVSVVIAFIINQVIGMINFIITSGISLYNMISNFAGGLQLLFSNPIDGIKVMFLSLFNYIVGIVEAAASMLDTVFGSSLAETVSGFQDKVQAEINTTLEANGIESQQLNASDYTLDRIEYGDAFNFGAQIGDGISDKISTGFDNLFSAYNTEEIDSAYTTTDSGSVADSLASIAGDTAAISDSVDISKENLKYLRDIAERDVINRFTTAEIKVDMQNNNNISSGMDIDGIVDQLTLGVQEAMEQAAEGVHS